MAKIDIRENLRQVLVFNNIPPSYFSLDGYQEEAVCLEETTEEYLVYEGESGNKYNVQKHNKRLYACYDIISRISESKEQEKRIRDEFITDVILDAAEVMALED